MSKMIPAGIVTAYGAAVRGGYLGTYEEFCTALGDLARVLEDFEGFSVSVTTLEPGESATADYSDGVLSLGIPAGETGNGIASAELNQNYTLTLTWTNGESTTVGPIRGAVGATPDFSIGTVTTGAAGSSAEASITGTPEEPVLNLTIPKGDPGEVPAAAIAPTEASTTASQAYAIGDYFWLSGTLYEATAAITQGGTIVVGTNCKTAEIGETLTQQKNAFAQEVGGGNVTLHATDLEPYEGYWSANVSSGKMALATSTSYYTIENPIDISSLKVSSDVSMMASVTSSYGMYIYNSIGYVLDYVNGNNAAAKGYTTSSTPQLVTLKVPENAKYIVSDIRKTLYTDMSIFDVSGTLKSNIDVLNEETSETEETVGTIVDSYVRDSDYVYPFFDVGGITISTNIDNPWTYDPTAIKYISTKEGYTIHLKPNDVVGMVDYTDGQTFSIGWRRKDGTYSRNLARTTDYTVIDEGDYVFVLYQNPFVVYEEPNSLASLFFVRRAEYTPAIKYKRLDKYPIKGIAHRGYTYEGAPENTYPSFRAAKTKGFHYVETDIAFTSDNVAVLLHDATINRVARNADGTELSSDVNIADITHEQALTYDFGIYAGQEYAGTKIMTVEELLIFCRANDVFPYFELKSQANLNTERLQQLLNIVKKYDMMDACAFISFSYAHLYNLSKLAPELKIGRISNYDFDDTTKGELLMLKTEINDVVLLLDLAKLTAAENAVVTFCQTNGIKLGIEMSNSISEMENANNYITECTSNHYNFTEVIANREMGITS